MVAPWRGWTWFACLLLLASVGLGCQSASPAPAPASGRGEAQAPAAPAATSAPRVESIRIVHSTRNGSQAIGALLGGDVDVALMGGETALSAAVEGAPIVVVGGFLNRRDHILFAVPEVTDLAALRGKRVGINGVTSADQRAVAEALQYAGFDPQDVIWVVQAGGPATR